MFLSPEILCETKMPCQIQELLYPKQSRYYHQFGGIDLESSRRKNLFFAPSNQVKLYFPWNFISAPHTIKKMWNTFIADNGILGPG